MGLFQRLSDKKARKQQVAVQEITGHYRHSPFCSTAENVFAQLRPLVDELKMVQPYGISKNGSRLSLSRTPELSALFTPNDEMGWAEFADLMFSTWLTEKELNIHVWKYQRGNVYGYTVLPVDSRKTAGGVDYFEAPLASGGTARYSRDEVMTLRFSRNPRDIDEGVSPGIASLIWSQIDDVMAQYQLGHFENGAVPAYITIIRASTKEKYLETRKEMEKGFHGARNKGKNLFLWRAFIPETGEDKDQVEIKTVQGSNASLAIKDIMAIVNDKLNKSFGVSNFIMGDDSSAKYDNAELSQQQFLSHRVYPALFSFWSQFEYELNRVVGGLGYSISWELEIPELTDRVKVKAETKKVEAETAKVKAEIENEKLRLEYETKKSDAETRKIETDATIAKVSTLQTLLSSGATPEAAVTALELDPKWLEVARNIVGKSQNPGEVQEISSQNSKEAEPTIDHACPHCHPLRDDLPQFSPDEIIERGIYDELITLADALVDGELGQQLGLTDEEVTKVVGRIVDKLTSVAEEGLRESQNQIIQSVKELNWSQSTGSINGKNPESKQELVEALEDEQSNTNKKTAEDLVKDKLATRVDEIVKNYQKEVQDIIREVLSSEEAKSAAVIRKELKAHIPKTRAEMIARNETVHAFRLAKLEEARAQAKKYGLKMRKVWQAHSGGCPICEQMNGTKVDINDAFPAGQVDEDGHIYAYDHNIYNENGDTPNAHVNCRCSFFVEVVDG